MKTERKYILPISISSLPEETENAILLGKVSGTVSSAYINSDSLVKHAFIVGASGTGKSEAAMTISEECLKKGVAVVVFDTSGNWKKRAKTPHDVVKVSYSDLNVSMLNKINAGKMTIFDLSDLAENDYNEFAKNSLGQMVCKNWETIDKLKILLVFEDAYRLSPRFGGKAAIMLEKACREFRKFGIGIVLITHSYSDFGPAVLGNVNTEIWFKTSHEQDLERIRKRFGPEYASSLVKLRIGECMIASIDYNYSKPWFVKIFK